MLKTRVFLKLIYLFCRGQIENIKKTQDPQTGASLTWILTSNGSQSELHVRGLSVIFFFQLFCTDNTGPTLPPIFTVSHDLMQDCYLAGFDCIGLLTFLYEDSICSIFVLTLFCNVKN